VKYRIAKRLRKTVPECQSMISERSIGYFVTRVACGMLKGDNSR